MQQLVDSLTHHFEVCWFSTICFLKLLFFWIYWLFFRIHIILSWRRDKGMTFQPIWISIWICDWRKNRPVDSIKIWYTVSLTLTIRSRTCGRLEMYQPLDARNQFWALKLQSSTDEYKLGQPILLLIMHDLVLRRLNSADW